MDRRHRTDLMRLAVGVEEGQAVQTLVVLREASEAEEESADAHLQQHLPLVGALGRQRFGHLDHLGGGRLRLPLPLAGRGLWGGLLRGRRRLRRGGRDGQRVRTRVCWDFGRRGLGERHHDRLHDLLDDFLFRLDAAVFSV